MSGPKKSRSIKTWDAQDRPREKLLQQGAAALSNAELLAILLRSGTGRLSAVDLARDVLDASHGSLAALAQESPGRLSRIEGVGPAKATAILAAFELSRRVAAELPGDTFTIRTADTVYRMMGPLLRDLPHEECWVLYLNRAGKFIGKEQISSGGTRSTVIDLKIIVKKAVERLAAGLILVHNHPSGNPRPGAQDRAQTEALRQAAAALDITLIDHVIVGRKNYFSFSEENS